MTDKSIEQIRDAFHQAEPCRSCNGWKATAALLLDHDKKVEQIETLNREALRQRRLSFWFGIICGVVLGSIVMGL